MDDGTTTTTGTAGAGTATNPYELDLPDITDPFFYAWWFIMYVLGVIGLSHLVQFGLKKYRKTKIKFGRLSDEKQRNVITYVVEIILTSITFPISLIGSMDITFGGYDIITSIRDLNMILFSFVLLIVMYLWELIYRKKFGWPLLIHHLMTIFIGQMMALTIYSEQSVVCVRLLIVLCFASNTEQLSFLALFFYRMNLGGRGRQAKLFFAAAAMSMVFKTIISIGVIIDYSRSFYGNDDDNGDGDNHSVSSLIKFWNFVFVPAVLILYGAQVQACKILYDLGNKCLRKKRDFEDKQTHADEDELAETEGSDIRFLPLSVGRGADGAGAGDFDDEYDDEPPPIPTSSYDAEDYARPIPKKVPRSSGSAFSPPAVRPTLASSMSSAMSGTLGRPSGSGSGGGGGSSTSVTSQGSVGSHLSHGSASGSIGGIANIGSGLRQKVKDKVHAAIGVSPVRMKKSPQLTESMTAAMFDNAGLSRGSMEGSGGGDGDGGSSRSFGSGGAGGNGSNRSVGSAASVGSEISFDSSTVTGEKATGPAGIGKKLAHGLDAAIRGHGLGSGDGGRGGGGIHLPRPPRTPRKARDRSPKRGDHSPVRSHSDHPGGGRGRGSRPRPNLSDMVSPAMTGSLARGRPGLARDSGGDGTKGSLREKLHGADGSFGGSTDL